MAAPWVELTAAILRGTPRLPGALCRGRTELFDADDEETAACATALCRRCPDKQPCTTWADTLRHNQVNGFLAGELRPWISHTSELRKKPQLTPRGTTAP
ncbi:hypothetical protein F0Q45_18765 [Mycobacterium simiae]|uniref:4Fe-4S Wbl-type domain-containing protein n=1 Tax=Mycobacterium simiae TaxID=1784 RepID=A0A5B1BMY8_MYCSI|nr:WhiB family transcriptional regulator [Mycobacterium simiae]KAA1248763.1 hypothetical protein F0Q45_18765 [Mycobacterium simiae]